MDILKPNNDPITSTEADPDPDISAAPSVAQRIATFEKTIVQHQKFTNAIKKIHALADRSSVPIPSRIMFLLGEAGAGKTTILEEASGLVADGDVITSAAEGQNRRFLCVEAPHDLTQKQLVETIYFKLLGKPLKKLSANKTEIIENISDLLDEKEIEIVLIDEAHHIVEHRSRDESIRVSEFLKSLVNRTKPQFVLAGTPSLKLLNKNGQFTRRKVPTVDLRPYNWRYTNQRASFTTLLDEFARNLPLRDAPNLSEASFAARIYCATRGHIGLVSKHLSLALEAALCEDKPTIDLDLLGRVYAELQDEDTEQPCEDLLAPMENDLEPLDKSQNPYLADDEQLKVIWTRYLETSGKAPGARSEAFPSLKARQKLKKAGKTNGRR